MKHWESEAIAIHARRHAENDAILEVFSEKLGRVSGYVYGGAGSRKRALLEPGQSLSLAWSSKSDEQLGYFERIESINPKSGILSDAAALGAISTMCTLLHQCLPEAMAYPQLFAATNILLAAIEENIDWPSSYVRWEAGLLSDTGFGLDLSECALTGVAEDLAWVSPKTGRAASMAAGLPFKDKLLRLPQFLLDHANPIEKGDIADGLALTGWFIERELLRLAFQDMPEARHRLIYALGRSGRL